MMDFLRTLQIFVGTLLLKPALALAQMQPNLEYAADEGTGWGWFWLIVGAVIVLAVIGWAAGKRRRRGSAYP